MEQVRLWWGRWWPGREKGYRAGGTRTPRLGSRGRERRGAGGRARGFALTPGGGRGRQALPAWYRGVWCPLLRPLKKLAALEFSVRNAFEAEASEPRSSGFPDSQADS